jgi:hypothetical protein
MTKSQKKSIRKLVTLSVELAERVEKFRDSVGAASESDALKALIEDGLKLRDRAEDLFTRFENATLNGQSIGEIINLLASDHPLVASTFLNTDSLIIYLKTEANSECQRFSYSREAHTWDWERQIGDYNQDRWESIAPRTSKIRTPVNDLDDDIPF